MRISDWSSDVCSSDLPERVGAAISIASAARHSAQNIAFHEVGRQAIMADPDWREGQYYAGDRAPAKGLAVARMAAHITSLSDTGLTEKFCRRLQGGEAKTLGLDAYCQGASYLRHPGLAVNDHFDYTPHPHIHNPTDSLGIEKQTV